MVTPLSALTEQERAQAMARFGVLQPFLEDDVELRQLAQQHQLALRTLRRWVQRYTTEGLAGLVRQRRTDRGGHRRLPAELHPRPAPDAAGPSTGRRVPVSRPPGPSECGYGCRHHGALRRWRIRTTRDSLPTVEALCQ